MAWTISEVCQLNRKIGTLNASLPERDKLAWSAIWMALSMEIGVHTITLLTWFTGMTNKICHWPGLSDISKLDIVSTEKLITNWIVTRLHYTLHVDSLHCCSECSPAGGWHPRIYTRNCWGFRWSNSEKGVAEKDRANILWIGMGINLACNFVGFERPHRWYLNF